MQVILVNTADEQVGFIDKLTAHQKGLLHRAFSIFIYRRRNNMIEILLQKRHDQKYHSGGLWTNTCCSHPLPQENIHDAARRRLKEEIGLEVHLLKAIGIFHYRAEVGNGLIENEMDHVFIGEYLEDPALPIIFNTEEISEICWISVNNLMNKLEKNSENYTAWLKEALSFLREYLSSDFGK